MRGKPFEGEHVSPFYYLELDSNRGNFFGLGNPKTYDGQYGVSTEHFETFKKLRHNRVVAFPPRSRIYIPKHVTIPRSKLRSFARESDSTITQKLESASCMVVDFFWLYQMGCFWYGGVDRKTYTYYEVEDANGDSQFLTKQAWDSMERNYPSDFTLIRPVRSLGYRRKAEVEAMDHLVSCLLERPDIPVVSYDHINDKLANNPLDNMDQPIKMVTMVMNTTDLSIAMLALEFISNLHPNKDRLLVWSLVLCMHSLQKSGEFRNKFKSVLHYNVMDRFLQKVGYIYLSGSDPGISSNHADVHCNTANKDPEQALAYAMRRVMYIIYSYGNGKSVPKAPLWLTKWWIEYMLTKYMQSRPSALNAKSVSKEDKVREAAYWITNTKSMQAINTFSDVLDLDIFTLLHYLVENYEQTQQSSWSPVGEEVCRKAKTPISSYRDEP